MPETNTRDLGPEKYYEEKRSTDYSEMDKNSQDCPDTAVEKYDDQKHMNDSEEHKNEQKILTYRIGKQICLILIWFSLGITNEMSGPTLKDLMWITKSNYEEISRALVARSVGFFIGSLGGGFLCDRLHRHVDLMIFIALMVSAATTAATPWFTNLTLMAIVLHVQGWTEGMLNAGGNASCFKLFGEKVPGPMHSMHFGFGIGAMVAPQIAGPFLKPTLENVDILNFTDFSTASSGSRQFNSSLDFDEADTRVEIAYGIGSTVPFVLSLSFLAFYLLPKPRGFRMGAPPSIEWKSILHPGSCAQGSTKFGMMMFPLLFLFYMHVVGGERAWGKFINSYVRDSDLKFSKEDAINVNTMFWAFFSGGRGLGIIIANWVPPRFMLAGEIILSITAGTLLSIIGHKEVWVLWICNAVLGLTIAPVFPSGMSWANRYLDMSAMACAVLLVGSASGGFVYQWLTGALFEYYGPNTLMYVMVGYALNLAILFAVMQFIAARKGERFGTGGTGGSVEIRDVDMGSKEQESKM